MIYNVLKLAVTSLELGDGLFRLSTTHLEITKRDWRPYEIVRNGSLYIFCLVLPLRPPAKLYFSSPDPKPSKLILQLLPNCKEREMGKAFHMYCTVEICVYV